MQTNPILPPHVLPADLAAHFGVSERTVSADVREMSRRLGARSRAHAIAIICGLGS